LQFKLADQYLAHGDERALARESGIAMVIL
jgi:hypothetical protein